MPSFVDSLLNIKEDAGTYFLSFHAFFYSIDDSVALLDCRVIGSEAKLVHGDYVINTYCFFQSLENKSSDTLDSVGRRLIGLYELVSVGGFPDLAIIIIWAYFHCTGK
jgi:hypothetical protein